MTTPKNKNPEPLVARPRGGAPPAAHDPAQRRTPAGRAKRGALALGARLLYHGIYFTQYIWDHRPSLSTLSVEHNLQIHF